jgi:hypothetical protein
MPERSALAQGVQVGVETTPGTNVAANKKFNSIGIDAGIETEMQGFRAFGNKYKTILVEGKEWTEGELTGSPTYDELTYLFASCLVSPGAPSTSDTTARTWTFNPATSAEDTVKTFTVEVGGNVRAHKFNYGLVTEIEIDMSRDGIEMGGTMIGQRLSDNITLTAGPTALPQVPIVPTDIDVYLDTTSAGLGTTKLTRVVNCTITLGDRFNPVWVLNSANNSYVAHVEAEPTATVVLLMEADAEGMAALTQMRAGTTKFMRVKATSPVLAGAATVFHSLTWDMAVKVSEPGDFDDTDGLYTIEWTFEMVHDGTWGKAMTVALVNTLTAL